jgi:hypothetical protein
LHQRVSSAVTRLKRHWLPGRFLATRRWPLRLLISPRLTLDTHIRPPHSAVMLVICTKGPPSRNWGMAKLKADPITATDLKNFVDSDSDFAFEMKVLAQLRSLEFDCEHAGSYQDPVSDKIRQFDIRAEKKMGEFLLALAVECKNLRPNYPLLLSAAPRTATESFHHVLKYQIGSSVSTASVVNVPSPDSFYKRGGMLGKKTDQVGVDMAGAFVSDDSAAFDKLNQAVNSSKDLVQRLVLKTTPPYIRVILPVLVVPTGRLWQVDYADDGQILTAPRDVDTATLFLNHSWTVGRGPHNPISYCLSHIELVTLGALPEALKTWKGFTGLFATFWGKTEPS